MEIVLTQELEELVRQKVASGAYSSPSEVVANNLHLLKEREALDNIRREELRRDILAAKEGLKRGEGKVYESPQTLMQEIIAKS